LKPELTITTKKSVKTNRIFLSVIFIDRKNFISNPVDIYRQTVDVGDIYRRHTNRRQFGWYIPTELCCWYIPTDSPTDYVEFWKKKQCDDVKFFQNGLTEWFKSGSPYSDVTRSSLESSKNIPTTPVCVYIVKPGSLY